MDCLDTIKSLKINRNKNIGEVIIIVEGAKDEMDLFESIFYHTLGYRLIEKRRTMTKFRDFKEYARPQNKSSRVVVINAKNSNISTLKKDSSYLNEIYKILYTDYGIDSKNARIYFIWDRDRESNTARDIKKFLEELSNSLDNDEGNMHGLLLLSYPCSESYLISSFDKKGSVKVDNIKQYIRDQGFHVRDITGQTMLRACVNMHNVLKTFNIKDYSPDDMKSTNLKIFDKQEEFYAIEQYYKWLSLISIIFVDLGIITER